MRKRPLVFKLKCMEMRKDFIGFQLLSRNENVFAMKNINIQFIKIYFRKPEPSLIRIVSDINIKRCCIVIIVLVRMGNITLTNFEARTSSEII